MSKKKNGFVDFANQVRPVFINPDPSVKEDIHYLGYTLKAQRRSRDEQAALTLDALIALDDMATEIEKKTGKPVDMNKVRAEAKKEKCKKGDTVVVKGKHVPTKITTEDLLNQLPVCYPILNDSEDEEEESSDVSDNDLILSQMTEEEEPEEKDDGKFVGVFKYAQANDSDDSDDDDEDDDESEEDDDEEEEDSTEESDEDDDSEEESDVHIDPGKFGEPDDADDEDFEKWMKSLSSNLGFEYDPEDSFLKKGNNGVPESLELTPPVPKVDDDEDDEESEPPKKVDLEEESKHDDYLKKILDAARNDSGFGQSDAVKQEKPKEPETIPPEVLEQAKAKEPSPLVFEEIKAPMPHDVQFVSHDIKYTIPIESQFNSLHIFFKDNPVSQQLFDNVVKIGDGVNALCINLDYLKVNPNANTIVGHKDTIEAFDWFMNSAIHFRPSFVMSRDEFATSMATITEFNDTQYKFFPVGTNYVAGYYADNESFDNFAIAFNYLAEHGICETFFKKYLETVMAESSFSFTNATMPQVAAICKSEDNARAMKAFFHKFYLDPDTEMTAGNTPANKDISEYLVDTKWNDPEFIGSIFQLIMDANEPEDDDPIEGVDEETDAEAARLNAIYDEQKKRVESGEGIDPSVAIATGMPLTPDMIATDEEIAEATGVSDASEKKRELLTDVAEILAPINDPAKLDQIIARYKQIGDPNYKKEEPKQDSSNDDDEDDDAFDEDDFFPDRRKEEKRAATIMRTPQKDDDEDENFVITRR
jgi:hypothetical protein